MRLVKYGIACGILVVASVLACGGSSSGGSDGAAGTSTSSAGSTAAAGHPSVAGNPSSGGSSSPGAGGSTSRGGGTATGSGGVCGTNAPQNCPALVTCLDVQCKSESDACTSTTGACGSYIQCTNACNCEQACSNQCEQPSACATCLQTYAACAQSKCFTEALSCLGGGAGGGFPSLDAGTKTCADLGACCATLANAQTKASCLMLVNFKNDSLCSLSYPALCPT